MKGEAGRSERLFRAAISAFCSLTRPSRREIAQLEDLALPLFDFVSVEARRFAAAALSECEYAPRALLMRLCNETVDIAAPLLIRSRQLADVDLITLIGRHGLPHARAIARRPGLNPAIAGLVKALDNARLKDASAQAHDVPKPAASETSDADRAPGASAEDARRRLRSMMLPSGKAPEEGATADPAAIYPKLRDSALTGNNALFQIAVASATGLDYRSAGSLVEGKDQPLLMAVLRLFDLSEERAFLIAAALFPGAFAHPEAIRLFLLRYRAIDGETAQKRVQAFKADAIASAIRHTVKPNPAPASSPAGVRLRAS
ncbi:uncharacterized protein (DUF2336 family) [Pseudaminobacter salicylatoxidans]|uniref:Uncharacterized protein (DUF2336 family) n=1 Tax=Pseudaminobacter salicylatoxidans TaxID=93369 RepID=A0A316C6K8_PSESE|nr:hypothetical protein [Pseudaminobacter salicylatoxidans]PWJ85339.1 uncharacterized protein (DUF2336 family) [Pseudaminobacter salicylatoxidans]